jgi:putative Holliday junction resolvase
MTRTLVAGMFLGFDYGTRRIGVASGNAITGTATPLETIDARRVDESFAAIGRLLGEWQPEALVVGIPRHPDGRPHEMTQHAERFARRLEGRFGVPVHRVDERWTSVEARSRGHADRLDAGSAAVILEHYLAEHARAATAEVQP